MMLGFSGYLVFGELWISSEILDIDITNRSHHWRRLR